ncbi:MBL fold metallo-hydrolase [Listeria monocytogenes]|nr:MBL fold metallo-hydrolase [Listeria monocytogenes]
MKKFVTTLFVFTAVFILSGCGSTETSKGNTSIPTEKEVPLSDKQTTNSSKKITIRTFDSTDSASWEASFQVISSVKGNILIDPGKYDEKLSNYIKSIGGVDAILITHGHWDKLRGLDDAIKANPDAKVYVHELDYPYFKDTKRNCSAEQGVEGTTNAKATTLIEGNYEISGYQIKVIHTPGHTEGSVLYQFPEENILIGGDTIMADKVAGSQHPGGNEAERKASITKFKKLSFPKDMRIYSGHGASTTYSELLQTNRDLQ